MRMIHSRAEKLKQIIIKNHTYWNNNQSYYFGICSFKINNFVVQFLVFCVPSDRALLSEWICGSEWVWYRYLQPVLCPVRVYRMWARVLLPREGYDGQTTLPRGQILWKWKLCAAGLPAWNILKQVNIPVVPDVGKMLESNPYSMSNHKDCSLAAALCIICAWKYVLLSTQG